jgi:phosphoglycerol transferase MdoB-like AlkP superfamily enzyme
LVGLAIPLVESGFVIWFPIAFWSVPLALAWLASRRGLSNSTRALRIAIALVLPPLLFITVWEGGWLLIPADLAWLSIEVADRGRVGHGSTSRGATG